MRPYFVWSFMAGTFGLIGPIAGLFVGGVPRSIISVAFDANEPTVLLPHPTPLPPAAFCCY